MHSAKLHLIHVLINWMPPGEFPVSPDFYKELENGARKQLDGLLSVEETNAYQACLELINGNSEFLEIDRHAENEHRLVGAGHPRQGTDCPHAFGKRCGKSDPQSPLPLC